MATKKQTLQKFSKEVEEDITLQTLAVLLTELHSDRPTEYRKRIGVHNFLDVVAIPAEDKLTVNLAFYVTRKYVKEISIDRDKIFSESRDRIFEQQWIEHTEWLDSAGDEE